MAVTGRAPGGWPSPASVSNECLISAETDIKAAAGFVAQGIRASRPPEVKAISAQNVNQALKTLALAHDYLEEEGADLYAQVDFPEFSSNPSGAKATLHVFKKKRRTNLSQVNSQVYVSGTSEPSAVAGFISNSIRAASLGRICVTACGPQPVLRALKAVFIARHHLRDEQTDLSIVPEFGQSDEGLSLVNIFVLSHPVGASL